MAKSGEFGERVQRSLSGHVAVVTGASSGLGHRFARLLASEGASVALMARRADRLHDLAAEIVASGGRAVVIPLDVSDANAIGPALDAAEQALGPLSILVNNAGVAGDGLALDLTVETFDETFSVNVRGAFFCARESASRMIANGAAAARTARIINIASIAAFTNLAGLTVYCASKAALTSMTKGLAKEWAKHNIAVNAICPGYIETEMTSDWFASDGGKAQLNRFPRRRLMSENSLDETLLLLAGRSASMITGAILTVDDGQSL